MNPEEVPNRVLNWLQNQKETFVIIRRAHINPIIFVIDGDHALELYKAYMNILKREAGFAPDGTRLSQQVEEKE